MKRLACIFLALIPLITIAQTDMTPREYFDSAANQFLDGKKRDAIKTLSDGLNQHPGNEMMLKLAEELLKQMEQQQNQQQQEQQKQQKEQEQQDKEGQEDGSKQDQEQEQEGDQSDESDGDPSDEEKEGEDNSGEKEDAASGDEEGERQDQSGAKEGDGLPPEAGKLSQEQAARLLKSLDQQDKNTKAKVMRAQQGKQKSKAAKPEKDW